MITKGNTQEAVVKYAKLFNYDGLTTNNTVMMTIFFCLAKDEKLVDEDDIASLMALWDTFPKNPSAFAKDVEKWLADTDEEGATVNAKANQYLAMLKTTNTPGANE